MRSLSLQVMGNCWRGLLRGAKQKLTLPWLFRFLLEGPPPSWGPPSPSGPPGGRSLGISVRPLLLSPPEKPALAPGPG